MSWLEKWRYLDMPRETVESLSDRVSQDNLKVLGAESQITAIIGFIFSILFFTLNHDLVKGFGLLGASVALFAINIVTARLIKKGSDRITFHANNLVSIFQIFVYGIGIFLGTYGFEHSAALMIGCIIAMLVSFNIFPKRNFLVLCFALVVFYVCSFFSKSLIMFMYDVMNSLCAAAVGLIVFWHRAKEKWEHEEAVELIEKQNTNLYQESTTDPLTGLMNRRNAFEKLEVLVAEAQVSGKSMSCLIMDVDYFKKYNDKYGHPQGDRLLSELGKILKELAGIYGITIARIGGEEFMAFGQPTSEYGPKKFARELITRVHDIPHPEADKGLMSTISVGIYQGVPTGESGASGVYSKADKAVYLAKENGRDRYEYYTE